MFRISVFTLLVSGAMLASLFAYSVAQRGQSCRFTNVGGSANHCTCTQRIER